MLASRLGLDPKTFGAALKRLAASSHILSRRCRSEVEELCAKNFARRNLLYYLDVVRYDEASMTVTIGTDGSVRKHALALTAGAPTRAGGRQLMLGDGPVDGGGGGQPNPVAVGRCMAQRSRGTTPLARRSDALANRVRSEGVVAKLMQTIQCFGLIVRIGTKLFLLLGTTIDTVSPLDTSSGQCIKRLQQKISGVSEWANSFDHTTRMHCLDRHPSNQWAESKLIDERAGSWDELKTDCEIHMTGTIHGKTFAFVAFDVSGIIHAAKALASGTAMVIFRRCVVAAAIHLVEPVVDVLPAEALDYQMRHLQLFLSHGSECRARRATLVIKVRADWRARGKIPILVDDVSTADKTAIGEMVGTALCTACCPAKYRIWNRARWDGADISVDGIGLLEGICGMFSEAFKRFVSVLNRRGGAKSAQPKRAPRAAALPAIADQADLDQEADNHAEQNDKSRRIGLAWVKKGVYCILVLIRLAMEPLRVLLQLQLYIGSEKFELDQRVLVAKASLAGGRADKVRALRLQIAARMTLEARAFEQLGMLFDGPRMWGLMTAEFMSFTRRCLAFRTASREGCMIEYYIRNRHRQWPFPMFLLLDMDDDEELIAQVRASALLCIRLLDSWSRTMLAKHPTLRGPIFQLKLKLCALLGFTDISAVEARHAAIRRQLMLKSVQTHTCDIKDLGALHIAQRARSNQCGRYAPRGVRRKAKRGAQQA